MVTHKRDAFLFHFVCDYKVYKQTLNIDGELEERQIFYWSDRREDRWLTQFSLFLTSSLSQQKHISSVLKVGTKIAMLKC